MVTEPAVRPDQVLHALGQVMDPEMPAVSIADLGMVHAVRIEGAAVRVTLLPTFVGCPALELIRQRAVHQIQQAAGTPIEVDVEFSTAVPWTSGRIAPECHGALRTRGIAPPSLTPPARGAEPVPCPWCGSLATRLESWFGPTACRAIYYCRACRNPFEAIKFA